MNIYTIWRLDVNNRWSEQTVSQNNWKIQTGEFEKSTRPNARIQIIPIVVIPFGFLVLNMFLGTMLMNKGSMIELNDMLYSIYSLSSHISLHGA